MGGIEIVENKISIIVDDDTFEVCVDEKIVEEWIGILAILLLLGLYLVNKYAIEIFGIRKRYL